MNTNTNQKVKRIPRPMGTTELNSTLSKQENKDNQLKVLTQHIVNHYINTNFNYCQQQMPIDKFAIYTNIDITLINTTLINRNQIQYNLLSEEGKKDINGAVMNMLLEMSLIDRSNALQHASILINAQGQNYVPFLSSEVTRALANAQSTTANAINFARTFFGSNAQGITINNNNNNAQNNNYLTVEKALEIANSTGNSKSLITDQEGKDALYLEHNLVDTPELNARLQTGFDSSKEGLNFGKVAEALLLEDDEALEGPKSHINRRADEYDIDLDNDDNI